MKNLTEEEKVEALILSKSMNKLATLINHKKENVQIAIVDTIDEAALQVLYRLKRLK